MSAGNQRISFRLEEDVIGLLDSQAESFGLSRSAFLRFLISLSPVLVDYYEENVDVSGYVATPLVMRPDLNRIEAELRRQGTNLNQATKAMNKLARSVHKSRNEDILMFLDLLQQNVDEVAEGFDEFDEMFREFRRSVFIVEEDGHVHA